jgi:hypothetical protein
VSLQASEKLPKWTWLLTLYLLFHLFVIFITPNSQNYFGYRLIHVFKPYINFFEFSSDWTFFSPDPAPPLYIEYKVFDRDGKEMSSGTFPESGNPFILGDRQIRRISAARFMLLGDGTAQKTLAPYLCVKNEGAFSVRLTRVYEYPPHMIDIIEGKKDVRDTSGTVRSEIGMEFCDDGAAKNSF